MLLYNFLLFLFGWCSCAPYSELISESEYSKEHAIYAEYREIRSISQNFKKIDKSPILKRMEKFMIKVKIFFLMHPLVAFASLESHIVDTGLVLLFFGIISNELKSPNFLNIYRLFLGKPREIPYHLRFDLVFGICSYIKAIKSRETLEIMIRIFERLKFAVGMDDSFNKEINRMKYECSIESSLERSDCPFHDELLDLFNRIVVYIKPRGKEEASLFPSLIISFDHLVTRFDMNMANLLFIKDQDIDFIVILINSMAKCNYPSFEDFESVVKGRKNNEQKKSLIKYARDYLWNILVYNTRKFPDTVRLIGQIVGRLDFYYFH
jgi:hypothetical protein